MSRPQATTPAGVVEFLGTGGLQSAGDAARPLAHGKPSLQAPDTGNPSALRPDDGLRVNSGTF